MISINTLFDFTRFRPVYIPELCVLAVFLIVTACQPERVQRDSDDSCVLEFDFSIGFVDPRFDVTAEQVKQSVFDALKIWETAVDSIIITYSDNGNNIIRLVYDERQEFTNQAREFENRLLLQEKRLEQAKNRFDRLEVTIARMQEDYNRISEETDRVLTAFNDWVVSINRTGGFSDEQSRDYQQRRSTVQSLQERDARELDALNQEIRKLNRLADELNREVDYTNQLVDRYNERFAQAAKINSGLYEGNMRTGTISVFHFSDLRELKVTLAHEIGHSWGLGHTLNPESIMFEYVNMHLTDADVSLAEEDIRAIRSMCR